MKALGAHSNSLVVFVVNEEWYFIFIFIFYLDRQTAVYVTTVYVYKEK